MYVRPTDLEIIANRLTDEGGSRHVSIGRAQIHEPESEREASPTATASSAARSSVGSSPAPTELVSDDTEPTSPALPPSASENTNPVVAEELEQLPRFFPFQSGIEENPVETSRESPRPAETRSPLASLTRSEQNCILFDDNVRNHHGSSRAPDREETSPGSTLSGKLKRKREGSPHDQEWRLALPAILPNVDNITFDHPACSDRAPCMDGQAGYKMTCMGAGPSRLRNIVHSHVRFDADEASEEQVKFILSRCPCKYTAYFQEAWEDWCIETIKKGRRRTRTKERHLSKRFCTRINGVIKEFCPDDPENPGPPELGSEDLPICLDDE